MKYLEELKKEAADGKAQIDAPAQSMKGVRKQLLGYEEKGDAAYYPMPPLTLSSILSATKLPSSKPKHEVVLLPNAAVSPTIGIGMGGLQARMRVKRPAEGVPSNSIVGQGLNNQMATGGAADLSLKPKTAAALPPEVLAVTKKRIAEAKAKGEDLKPFSVQTIHPGAKSELDAARTKGRVLGGLSGILGGGIGGHALGSKIGPRAGMAGAALGAMGGGLGLGHLAGKGMQRDAVRDRLVRGDPILRTYFVRAKPQQPAVKTAGLMGGNFTFGSPLAAAMKGAIPGAAIGGLTADEGEGLQDAAVGGALGGALGLGLRAKYRSSLDRALTNIQGAQSEATGGAMAGAKGVIGKIEGKPTVDPLKARTEAIMARHERLKDPMPKAPGSHLRLVPPPE